MNKNLRLTASYIKKKVAELGMKHTYIARETGLDRKAVTRALKAKRPIDNNMQLISDFLMSKGIKGE